MRPTITRMSGTRSSGCGFLVLLLASVWLLAVVAEAVEPGEIGEDYADAWRGFSTSCTFENAENASISCHGVRIVRRIVQQLLENSKKEPSIEILDGVSLVEAKSEESSRNARLLKGFGPAAPFLQFLEGRELRIKLPNLLPENLKSVFEDSLPKSEGRSGGVGGGGYKRGGGGGGGKRGKKGGGGGLMIMALMMGKMMATLGFGALAMVAMKALLVSSLALMLSLIIGIKKLASQGNDHGGHHVVYAQDVGHHHHHKRSTDGAESIDLPYRGYTALLNDLRVS